jgi:hypothetical protein
MLAPNPRRGRSPERFFRRLDRAAAALNPILTIIAIGLVILDIICVFSLVLPLGRTYPSPDLTGSSAARPALGVDATAAPDLQVGRK